MELAGEAPAQALRCFRNPLLSQCSLPIDNINLGCLKAVPSSSQHGVLNTATSDEVFCRPSSSKRVWFEVEGVETTGTQGGAEQRTVCRRTASEKRSYGPGGPGCREQGRTHERVVERHALDRPHSLACLRQWQDDDAALVSGPPLYVIGADAQ